MTAINETLPLNVGGISLHTDNNKKVYLKSGVVETDLTKYPLGSISTGLTEAGKFTTNAQASDMRGMCKVRQYWMLQKWGDIWRYSIYGTAYPTRTLDDGLTDHSLMLADQSNLDNSFWIRRGTRMTEIFNSLGVATGRYKNVPNYLAGIINRYFWIWDKDAGVMIQETMESGSTPTGLQYPVDLSMIPSDPYYMTSDGSYWYIVSRSPPIGIFKFNMDFTYTGQFMATSEDPKFLNAYAGKLYYYSRYQTENVRSLTFYSGTGIGTEIIDKDTGQPIYLRVE